MILVTMTHSIQLFMIKKEIYISIASSVFLLDSFCIKVNIFLYTYIPLDDTNISVLLSLCKEYQIHWLTHHVEEYLVSSRKYNFGCQNNLEGLKIAEEFDLATLKSIILNCRLGSLEELRQFAEYEHLSENTKYELARKEILRLKNVQLQNECMKMIGYLDEIFLK